MTAYTFDLPSIREGIDIQDAMVFSKPYLGLDGRPIPFETLQGEISLTHKGSKALARHGNTFILDAVGENVCLYHCTRNAETVRASIRLLQETVLWRKELKQKSLRPPVSASDADGRQRCRCVA